MTTTIVLVIEIQNVFFYFVDVLFISVTRADELCSVLFKVGILAVLRSKAKSGSRYCILFSSVVPTRGCIYHYLARALRCMPFSKCFPAL